MAQVKKKAKRAFEAVLVELGFVGPFRLKTVELVDKKDQRRKTRQLVPVGEGENDRVLQALRCERRPFIFPVAAFRPVLGRLYDCLIRLREGARVIEAVPATEQVRNILHRQGLWDARPRPAPRLEFVEKGGRWSSRLQDGSLVIPFDVDITSAKTVFEAGELAIRPASTRTFWIAGLAEEMGKVSEERIDALALHKHEYDENGNPVLVKLPFDPSCAPQFRIFGRFVTAFESFGYPTTALIVDADGHRESIRDAVEGMIAKGMDWWRKTFSLTLHPDVAPDVSDAERERRGVLFAESASERDQAAEWLRDWAAWTEAKILAGQRDEPPPEPSGPDQATEWLKDWAAWAETEVLAGRKPTFPLPIGREPRVFFKKHAALVELDRGQLVDLFVTGQPAAVPPPVLPQRPVIERKLLSPLESATTRDEMRQAIASRTKAKLEAFERRRKAGEKPAARPAGKPPTRPTTTTKAPVAAVNTHGVRKIGDTAVAQPPTERTAHEEGSGGASVADRLDEAIRAKLAAKAKRTPLTDVPGVGPETAKKLEQSGIRSAEQLARTDPADIELQLGGKAAEKLIRAAQELLNDKAAVPPKEAAA